LCLLGILLSESAQFLKLIVAESINGGICISFILSHVQVPSLSKLIELLCLYLFDVDKLLFLGFAHASQLTNILILLECVHFGFAALGFKVVQFSMALIKVVLHKFKEGDDFHVWCAINIFRGQHCSILLQEI